MKVLTIPKKLITSENKENLLLAEDKAASTPNETFYLIPDGLNMFRGEGLVILNKRRNDDYYDDEEDYDDEDYDDEEDYDEYEEEDEDDMYRRRRR
ncbi:MAG TPA: hypothetical protein VNM22_20010 [Candidatus Limnocylindrales bacterium]|nr:hypothetical protein [Candidatus Limnocylindrales bacterium]